jgi:hypothetical protein
MAADHGSSADLAVSADDGIVADLVSKKVRAPTVVALEAGVQVTKVASRPIRPKWFRWPGALNRAPRGHVDGDEARADPHVNRGRSAAEATLPRSLDVQVALHEGGSG